MRIFRIAGLAYVVAVFGALGSGLVSCTGTEIPDPDDALYGTVRNQQGRPAAGARVIAWAQSDAIESWKNDTTLLIRDTVVTNSRGRFVFKDTLAAGHYNIFFEDSSAEPGKPALGLYKTYYDSKGRTNIPMKLSHPSVLVLTVRDTLGILKGAVCEIEGSPYKDTSDTNGAVFFIVPSSTYTVSCTYSVPNLSTKIWNVPTTLELASGSNRQETVYLYTNGVKPDLRPLPAPASLSVSYDENSGIALLTWPPVNDSRLRDYGFGKVNVDSGGGATELSIFNTFYSDVVFGPSDSVQMKNLVYSISSHKVDLTDNAGSRRTYANLAASRPWAYGARIDSLKAVPRDSGYRAGDTVRFAGFWNNRMNENDTLYWWVQVGSAELREIRVHPLAKGSDTLSVVLPETGEYKVNLSIHDAEGYRSWLALPFRL
jgi:hypothetical protein